MERDRGDTEARLLVCAPHTDDAELGCGGAIAKQIERGVRVQVAAFSRAEDSLPAGASLDTLELEMRASLRSLGLADADVTVFRFPVRRFGEHRQAILDELIRLRRDFRPTRVFTTSSTDVHQDHEVVHAEVVRAFRASSIWGYELPWNQITANLTGFVPLREEHVEAKTKALAHYESQLKLQRSYFSPDFARSLARLRGLQIGVEFAEAFEVVRSIDA